MTSEPKSEVVPRPGSRILKDDDKLRSTSGQIYHRLETPTERSRINYSSLVLVSFCVCSAVGLTFALLSISYLSGVERELDALRQKLEKLEEKLSEDDARGRDENEISISSKTEIFSTDRSSFLLAQSLSAGHVIESRAGEEPEMGGDRKRLRRSSTGQTERKRNEQPKAKAKAKAAKKQTESYEEKNNSAVHFEPKDSRNRTFTTKRGSPVLDFWETAKWWKAPPAKSFFHIRDGVVTILEDGTYFIYVQLVFHDLSGRWSFSVNINDRQELKCINSEHISTETAFHPTNHGVYQHCFSSRLFHVRRLEQVTVRCLYEHRQILLNPEFTFWGIVKMS